MAATLHRPQLVMITFDDSVNDLNRDLYKEIFRDYRLNPNGCPISATFYVSHEWTDYGLVQSLYSGGSTTSWIPRRRPCLSHWETRNPEREEIFRHLDWEIRKLVSDKKSWSNSSDGHEIASHSISHSFGEQVCDLKLIFFNTLLFQFSKKKWMKEMAGQREILSGLGRVYHLVIYAPTRRRYWPKTMMTRLVLQGLPGSSWKMFGGSELPFLPSAVTTFSSIWSVDWLEDSWSSVIKTRKPNVLNVVRSQLHLRLIDANLREQTSLLPLHNGLPAGPWLHDSPLSQQVEAAVH